MRRLICILLSAVAVLACSACGTDRSEQTTEQVQDDFSAIYRP